MTKQSKFLFIIIIIALICVIFLMLSLKKVSVNEEKNISDYKQEKQLKIVNIAKLESDYKNNLKPIFGDFEKIFNNTNASSTDIEKITKLKVELIKLQVPEQFKKMHLELVFAFSDAINFFESNQKNKKKEIIFLIQKTKENYKWLN